LTVGLVVRRGERTWELKRELDGGVLVFEDRLTGKPWSVPKSDLWRQIQSQELAVVIGDSPDRAKPAGSPSNLLYSWTSFPEKYRDEVQRRVKYIDEARRAGLTRGMRSSMARFIARVAGIIGDQSPPRPSTLMRWMRLRDLGHGTPAALLSRHAVRARVRRVPAAVIAVCREGLRTHYCTQRRPTLKQTQIHIEQQLTREVAKGRLKEEDATISYMTLQRLKSEIDPHILDTKRFGAAYARNRWRYSLSGPGCERALQRYEIDHTVLDVVVVCDKTGMPLGRPTLTVVIDAYSGYVVGFFISFWGTGLAATFCALKVSIAPKDDLRPVVAGLKHEWLGMGLPEELVLDNGLEFHSPQFRQVALQLALDLQYCAVRQPWLKPFVERTMGSVLNYLPFAGRIRKSLNNELPLNPAETAAVTFSELVRGLMIAFCDVHAFEVNQRKLARPFDLFSESLAALPPPSLPVGTQELDIIVAPSQQLTVGNEGVGTTFLRFNSADLQELRRRTANSFKTVVKFDPESLGHVWVQDPKTAGWLMVPSCHPTYTNGLSIVQHRAIRALKRDALKRSNADDVLLAAKTELSNMWNSRTVRGRRLKGEHLRAMSALTSSHALNAPDDAPESQIPTSKIVCTEEMVTPTREVPVFSGFQMA